MGTGKTGMGFMSFNPLERGNSNQILSNWDTSSQKKLLFQSPRTGKFESNFQYKIRPSNPGSSGCFNPLERGNSNQIKVLMKVMSLMMKFQTPRTGKFESNAKNARKLAS